MKKYILLKNRIKKNEGYKNFAYLDQLGFPFELGGMVKSSPIIVDIDNDGDNEIIFGTMSGMMVTLNYDGSYQEGNWPIQLGGQFWASPAVEDIDNDGNLEIIISNHNKYIYVFDQYGNIEMNYYTNQFLVGTPAVGNLDLDDELEIVFSGIGQNSKLFAINSDTSWVTGFPIDINENVFTRGKKRKTSPALHKGKYNI